MNEAYYNRVMSRKLEDFLNDEKYNWLIRYVKDNPKLDFQTGSNKDSEGKVTKSWFSIYRGTGRILTLECGSGPKAGLLIHAANRYKEKDKDLYKGETWKSADIETLTGKLDNLLKEIEKDDKLGRYYQDSEGNKKEGYYQTLISRRYSLYCKPKDDLIILDKEFVIGYKDEDTKDEWLKKTDNWISVKVGQIKANLEKYPHDMDELGTECDFLGINADGDIVLLELKRPEDSTKVYLGPLQVAHYGELTKQLLAEYMTEFKQTIENMFEQKKKLGLIQPAWDTLPEFSGRIKLAVVIGKDYDGKSKSPSKEVARRIKIVKDIVDPNITINTSEIDGTLIKVTL